MLDLHYQEMRSSTTNSFRVGRDGVGGRRTVLESLARSVAFTSTERSHEENATNVREDLQRVERELLVLALTVIPQERVGTGFL